MHNIKLIVSYCLLIACVQQTAFAQRQLEGRILSGKDKQPLKGANVHILPDGAVVFTDDNGFFRLQWNGQLDDSIYITHLGFVPLKIAVNSLGGEPILLEGDESILDEVEISTGYYTIPKERAAGSFTHIDNELLNRNSGSNILERLEGIVNGLQFSRGQLEGEDIDGAPELRVRGVSTLYSDSRPLIVVDNFPFEDDLNAINPNDVESVTVLKDASAASIWGARAGNGVIVITMKQGRYQQPTKVSFQSYVNFREKPDLFYSQNYLNPATVMGIQKELLERGVYNEDDHRQVPLYAEWLIKQRDGLISDGELQAQEASYRQSDIRRDALQHLYRVGSRQQYTLGIRGGEKTYRYYIAAGYDKNFGSIIGNDNSRLSLSLQNAFRLNDHVELEGGIWYTKQSSQENGVSFSSLGTVNAYAPLLTAAGNPAAIQYNQAIRFAYQEQAEENGLLDWLYRPLDEQRYSDNSRSADNVRMNVTASYKLPYGLQLKAMYQFANSSVQSRSYFSEESYYTRNLINRFTQADGSRIIPIGGILALGAPQHSKTQAGRLQVDFRRQYSERWDVAVLVGGEAGQTLDKSSVPFTFYGYNPSTGQGTPQHNFSFSQAYPTRPRSSSRVPYEYRAPNERVNRTVSYYANGAISLDSRYVLNGSIRWDASNLLGVKTNQRGTALWSVGSAWELNKEPFYDIPLLAYLRLRATYGAAGNINKSVGHYPVISRQYSDLYGGVNYANLLNPGNPNLRWEQVNTLNIGMDWRLAGGAWNGSIEMFRKDAKYLLSNLVVDPTTGVDDNYMENYADMRTQGLDVTLSHRMAVGAIQLENTFLVNYSSNKVTRISLNPPVDLTEYLTGSVYIVGRSKDAVYALPWYGLNPATGQPLIYQGNEVSDDYRGYYESLKFEDLSEAGVTMAPWYGSLRTGISWRGFQATALLSFRSGHVFRRRSIAPGVEYLANGELSYHMDYYRRWQQRGDERHTDVPARLDAYDAWINNIYTRSEALITPADNIRLQDVNISYSLDPEVTAKVGLSSFSVYASARNLGIIWRKNRNGIDPDLPFASYPSPRQWTMGIRAQF